MTRNPDLQVGIIISGNVHHAAGVNVEGHYTLSGTAVRNSRPMKMLVSFTPKPHCFAMVNLQAI